MQNLYWKDLTQGTDYDFHGTLEYKFTAEPAR